MALGDVFVGKKRYHFSGIGRIAVVVGVYRGRCIMFCPLDAPCFWWVQRAIINDVPKEQRL